MKQKEFDRILSARLEDIKERLGVKGKIYTRVDRLSNFKRAGQFEQCSPEKALREMMTKHLVAIYDMVDDVENGWTSGCSGINLEEWNEKIGDTIAYLILLEALIAER